MKKIDLKILFLKYLAFTAMIEKTLIINDGILQLREMLLISLKITIPQEL
jgi:phage tail protein X